MREKKKIDFPRLLWLALTVGALSAAVAVLNVLTRRKKRERSAHGE